LLGYAKNPPSERVGKGIHVNIGKALSGWVGGLLAAIAIVVIGIAAWWLLAPQPDSGAPEAPAAELAAVPAAEPDATQEADEPVAEPEAAAALAPTFDVVRIKPDGNALVAGKAEPGARIAVLVEGAPVAEVETGAGADFVALFDLPPIETDRVMTLEATLADGTRLASETSVIIEGVEVAPVVAEAETPELGEETPERPEPEAAQPEPGATPETGATPDVAAAPETDTGSEVAALEPEPETPESETAPVMPAPEADAAPDGTGPPALAEAEPAPETTPAPETAPETAPEPEAVAAAETPAEPEAPRILIAGPDGLRVVQDTGPDPVLSVDAIAYDSVGEIALSGRAQNEETLRVYVNNEPVGDVAVDDGGQWHVPLPDIDAGVYTLRVDAIAPDGSVTARVETPFVREEPGLVVAAGAEAASAGQSLTAVTIQPGHTLWAIAKGRYGQGESYWAIFDANRDQIRDPDWIYPGQVFSLPDTAN